MNHNKDQVLQLLSLIDLTSLNDNDTPETIIQLCKKATIIPDNHVAAVCVYPLFVPIVVEELYDTDISIATVVNFPFGTDDPDAVVYQTRASIAAGANEIDLVLPYEKFLDGDVEAASEMVRTVKEVCEDGYDEICLKVILETGAFKDFEDKIDTRAIREATHLSIVNGADFVKTSTGKIKENASLEAAKVILEEIRRTELLGCNSRGMKISGGIKTVAQADEYIKLSTDIMGEDWIYQDNLRFGASSLIDDILNILK